MLRRFTGDRQGSDVDAADVRSAGSDLYGRNSRDDCGHADRDIELVWSGVDCLKDVLAADVSVRCLRNRENVEQ